jgi:hypothetical protein
MDRERAPAAADFEDVIARAEIEPIAQPIELVELRGEQILIGRVENRARIGQ